MKSHHTRHKGKCVCIVDSFALTITLNHKTSLVLVYLPIGKELHLENPFAVVGHLPGGRGTTDQVLLYARARSSSSMACVQCPWDDACFQVLGSELLEIDVKNAQWHGDKLSNSTYSVKGYHVLIETNEVLILRRFND